jgi:enolase
MPADAPWSGPARAWCLDHPAVAHITAAYAREVLDSRGRPTVEVELGCSDGSRGVAMVPSGASTGSAEALELRDEEPGRYRGLGVRRAVQNVRAVLGPAIVGCDPMDQAAIDARLIELDGTPNKSRLGANAVLGVSLAAAQAAAAVQRVELYRHLHELWRQACGGDAQLCPPPRLPLPMTNMISGGRHAGGNLDFQDFLISPTGAPDYATALEWIVRVYWRLSEVLTAAGHEGRLVGDEGGYGPRLNGPVAALEFILRAIEEAGLCPGSDVVLNLDVAATQLFDGERYHLRAAGGRSLTSGEMIDELASLAARFPIASIEDGLAEEDWLAWQVLTLRLRPRLTLIGDDLFATHAQRVERGIALHAASGVLIKMNQVGTLTQTLETMRLARAAGLVCVVSARSGETEDTTMADLAVATGAEQIKIGSVARSERLAKYNRLLRIAERLEA